MDFKNLATKIKLGNTGFVPGGCKCYLKVWEYSLSGKCDTTLKKGTSAYYWPSNGKLHCLSCGESEYRQFLSAAADESVYLGIGNSFAG